MLLTWRSVLDESVRPDLRGKYLAFTQEASKGVQHLKELQQAGLTHVHLLPAYDYGSVPERFEDQKRLEVGLQTAAPPPPPHHGKSYCDSYWVAF